MPNYIEYAYGTDPGDPSSRPEDFFAELRPETYYITDNAYLALHVPRPLAHVPAVLQTSRDFQTWTPSPVPLRTYPKSNGGIILLPPQEYDSGAHQVIILEIDPDEPVLLFRIKF